MSRDKKKIEVVEETKPEAVLERIRRAAKKGNVRCAPTDKVNSDREIVDDIIQNMIGIESYFISDMSSVRDFLKNKRQLNAVAKKIKKKYGVLIPTDDETSWLIVDVIKRIKTSNN